MNYRGVTRTARLARILIAIVLAVLTVVVIANLAGGSTDTAHLTDWASPDGGWYGILQSAGLLFFTFAGYARIATWARRSATRSRPSPAPS